MTVNYTNILEAAFTYQSALRAFYVLKIWVCNFLAKGFWRKSCSLNVGEIDTWVQCFKTVYVRNLQIFVIS